jgi:type II protein arginine methyltransferase
MRNRIAIQPSKKPMANIIASLDDLLTQVADKPAPMAALACQLLDEGHPERARELATRALAMAPRDPEVMHLVATVLSHGLPDWHFKIIHDEARNAAYDGALRRAVRPGDRVLEIGTGTGLLAMMAARAGAREVVTCDVNAAVAEMASRIVANNGFADHVRVVAKKSADLKLGIDLDAPADLLVSEIISNNLIGEGVLPAIEQAAPLLKPGARVIPARGSIHVALAEDREAHRMRMEIVDGFDLSAFNRFAPPFYKIKVGSPQLILRSKPHELFGFDLQSLGPFSTGRKAVSIKASGGLVGGIAQWIRLEMDAEGSYENAPSPGAKSSWALQFFPLARTIELAPGAELIVHGVIEGQSLRLWAEVPSRANS